MVLHHYNLNEALHIKPTAALSGTTISEASARPGNLIASLNVVNHFWSTASDPEPDTQTGTQHAQ